MTTPRQYIARIPVNTDHQPGDISNTYIFETDFHVTSKKRMLTVGREMVKVLHAAGQWPDKALDDLLTLPDQSFIDLAERYTHPYTNVERMDTTKYGYDTTFQHDYGSFGTDTRKVFKITTM